MSRTIPAGIDADLDDRFIRPVWFVALDFDTDPLYVHSDIGNISVLSQTWLGVGGLGSISPIEEEAGFSAPGLSLRFDATDDSAGSIFEELTAQNFQQRGCVVYWTLRDVSTGVLAADPFVVYRGKCDTATAQDGDGTSFVELSVEHEFLDFKRSANLWFSKAAAVNGAYSADTAFDYIAIMKNVSISWGGKLTARLGGSATVDSSSFGPRNPLPSWKG